VLGVLTTPMPLGELIAGCDGLRVSEVAPVVDELEKSGQIRRSKDGILERA
jgi:DNA-binding MarR family transcriptional regulator